MKQIVVSAFMIMLTATAAFAQKNLVVLHVNDTHSHEEPLRERAEKGGLGGVVERAAYVDSVRTADGKKNVLLLHAGASCLYEVSCSSSTIINPRSW